MNAIRTLIAEDEKPARERLRNALRDMPEVQVVGEAKDGQQALELIHEHKPELLFLDVQMPLLDGFELLQQLDEKPLVVFTTAYDEYAIQAFEVHAIDYLLKPYSKERLRAAVARAVAGLGDRERNAERLIALLSDHQKTHGHLQRVSVKDRYAYRVVPVCEIDFFKAEEGLVFLHQSGERSLIDTSLTQLEGQLDPERFFRLHRNAIANLDRIERVVPWGQGKLSVIYPGGQRLFVGRSRQHEFKRRMGLEL